MSVANLKDTVTDLFSGNPFATEVGHRIEQASDPKLGSENWGLFMEICDLVNESEDNAKDAARAIKKRLHNTIQAKDFDAVQLCLTILETCVKNCGRRFQAIVCSKDYTQELVKLIGPRYEPPVIVQERVLGLIQNWAETFRSTSDLRGVTEVYDELKAKGVEFPVLDLETMAPIITPQRTVAAPAQPTTTARRTSYPTQQQQQIVQEASMATQYPTGPVSLTPEQVAKLRGEVDIVKSNMQVFADMLNEMKPGQEDPDDLQLLVDLQTTIRAMQDRIVQLLGTVSNEEVTGELLTVNDEMNALFMRYERYERQRKGAASVQSRALPQLPLQGHTINSVGLAGHQQVEPSTLIDLSEAGAANRRMDHLQQQMGSMTMSNQMYGVENRGMHKNDQNDSDNEDFGAFALSRVGQNQPQTLQTSPRSAFSPPQTQQHPPAVPTSNLPPEGELAEMENWLKTQSEGTHFLTSDRPPLSSSEFDRFLESRAVAADQLPSITNRKADEKAQTKQETSHLLDS